MADELQSCATCRNSHTHGGNTVCRLAPPQPMLVGMTQTPASVLLKSPAAAGGVMPVIQGFFSPTAADSWCGQWRGRDFAGDRPALPPRAAETVSYRT